jgi:hypothetical protein
MNQFREKECFKLVTHQVTVDLREVLLDQLVEDFHFDTYSNHLCVKVHGQYFFD